MAVVIERRRADNGSYRLGTARITALLLLLVLTTGLSITNFTSGWIGYLPYHDHLILNARAIGLSHHAHHGDPLDQALRALQSVAVAPVPGQPHNDGVVSFSAQTAQPELNSTTANGLVGAFPLPLPTAAADLLLLMTLLLLAGRRFAPPAPPPRPA